MTAPGERFVLVTVKIRAMGRRCGDYQDDEGKCAFLREDYEQCDLFQQTLATTRVDRRIGFARCLRCLALDGPELSAAEAYRHG